MREVAAALPFPHNSFDAPPPAIPASHHRADAARRLAELRRVARRRVILTTQADRISRLWLRECQPPSAAPVWTLAAEAGPCVTPRRPSG
jgi:hypothetical protein